MNDRGRNSKDTEDKADQMSIYIHLFCVCVFASLCAFLYLLHTEHENSHSTSKSRMEIIGKWGHSGWSSHFTALERSFLRVRGGFRFGLGFGFGFGLVLGCGQSQGQRDVGMLGC